MHFSMRMALGSTPKDKSKKCINEIDLLFFNLI